MKIYYQILQLEMDMMKKMRKGVKKKTLKKKWKVTINRKKMHVNMKRMKMIKRKIRTMGSLKKNCHMENLQIISS